MKKLALGLAALALAACAKDIPQNPPPDVVTAEFDPGASPPVVPSPNDLAFNPASGTLNVPPGGSSADAQFAAYLNTLNGFPADALATANFTGSLDPASVNSSSVRVFEIDTTQNPPVLSEVTGATPSYADVTIPNADGTRSPSLTAPGQIAVSPPGGAWQPGHSYMAVIVGYGQGVKGSKGQQVVGSPAWSLLRSTQPLAVCDSSGQNCRATTGLIPSGETEPAARLADQGNTAAQLEALRQKYAPFLDYMEKAQSIPRSQVALLWTFKIADGIVTPSYALAPDKCATKIPLPNDLAIDPQTGLVAAPANCAGQTPSEQEFTADYLNHLDGFPTAAVVSETFVGGNVDGGTLTLDSDHVVFADLTEVANEVDAGTFDPDADLPGGLTDARVHYDATQKLLVIDPPAGGWPKGHQFAVALLDGIQGSNGEALVASDVFALVRSSAPLVDCDLTDAATDPSTCHSALTLAPLSDAQAVQLEQIRLGLAPVFDGLGLDRSKTAVLWTFKIFDNPELQFDPVNQILPFPFSGRAVPATNQLQLFIPGPDGGPGGHVNLPVTPGDPNAGLYAGLDTLDGFSTTAPILTAFGGTFPRDLTDDAGVDPATLTAESTDGGAATAGLINLAGTEAPQVMACVNCDKASRFLDGGAMAEPEHLAIVPQIPLLEQTDYAAYVTTGVKDTEGRGVVPSSVFALLRMKNHVVDSVDPACAVYGGVCIPALAQAVQAGQLSVNQLVLIEQIRTAYQGLFDKLDAKGLARGDLALAWDFHTQTTWTSLVQLHSVPGLMASQGFPVTANYAFDATTSVTAAMTASHAPTADVGKVFVSSYETPFLLTQADGTYGPFNPAILSGQQAPGVQKVPLIIFEPSTAAPAGGYPVVIYGHGITRWRNDVLALANALNAAGIAVVAFDEPFHGDRTFCVGAGQAIAGALGSPNPLPDATACIASGSLNPGQGVTCEADPNSPSYGRCLGTNRTVACDAASVPPGVPGDVFCQNQGLGNCAPDELCEGAGFLSLDGSGLPAVSGWDFIDLPALPTQFFFPTRDHFRQDVVDLGQLELVLAQPASVSGSLNADLVAAGGSVLDGTQVNYVGQSLGGILGSLYTASSTGVLAGSNLPVVQNAVLNVPGGALSQLILTSPGLAVLRNPLLGGLSQAGAPPGSPTFDLLINFATWVLDPADPVNSANHLNNPAAGLGPLASPPDRHVLVQFIENDQTVVNPSTLALLASANRDPANPQAATHEYTPSVADWPLDQRHGFLLNGYAANPSGGPRADLTAAAQTEAANFVADGGVAP